MEIFYLFSFTSWLSLVKRWVIFGGNVAMEKGNSIAEKCFWFKIELATFTVSSRPWITLQRIWEKCFLSPPLVTQLYFQLPFAPIPFQDSNKREVAGYRISHLKLKNESNRGWKISRNRMWSKSQAAKVVKVAEDFRNYYRKKRKTFAKKLL